MEPIYLRHMEPTDLERTYRWHNDPALYASLGGPFRYVSRAAEEEWIRGQSGYSRDAVNLAICVTGTDEHIGNIYLRDIDWIARKVELHIFIGAAKDRGKGYGRSAVSAVLNHAFRDLGLQRVYLTVLAANQPAVHAYEKCGFQVEGRLRRHFYKDGAFIDALVMGVCACDVLPPAQD